MKTNKIRSICVYTCTIYHHTCITKLQHKMIHLVDLPSLLYERPGQNKRPVLNQMFLLFFRYFQCFSHIFHKKHNCSYKKWQCLMKTNKTIVSICVYTCTIYTHMHHQIPPKYKIYLVGLPCELYERPGQNKRPVLNQLFLLLFRYFQRFSHTFHKKHQLFIQKWPCFMKTNKIGSICVYTCTIYTHMHHMHHQIPPNYKIYLVGLPSVLYERPSQNERFVLNQLFLLLFSAFHLLLMKRATFHENKQNQVNICVYMHHLHIHAPLNTIKI